MTREIIKTVIKGRLTSWLIYTYEFCIRKNEQNIDEKIKGNLNGKESIRTIWYCNGSYGKAANIDSDKPLQTKNLD